MSRSRINRVGGAAFYHDSVEVRLSEDALMGKPLEEVSPIAVEQAQRRESGDRNPPAWSARGRFSLGAAG
jgi:hypothetical protein